MKGFIKYLNNFVLAISWLVFIPCIFPVGFLSHYRHEAHYKKDTFDIMIDIAFILYPVLLIFCTREYLSSRKARFSYFPLIFVFAFFVSNVGFFAYTQTQQNLDAASQIDKQILAYDAQINKDLQSYCNKPLKPELPNNEHTRFELYQAANNGLVDAVKCLLDRGAKSAPDIFMNAAGKGYTDIVKVLLDKGADIDEKERGSWDALTAALRNGHIDTVQLLLNRGAKMSPDSLEYAVSSGRIDIVKLLLDKGAKINEKYGQEHLKYGGDDVTVLMVAANTGNMNMIKFLLDKGAQIDEQSDNGNTALISAAREGHAGVVQLLLDKGANINERDDKGRNALITAVQAGQTDIVSLLLDKGAKTDHTLLLAAREDHPVIVKHLLDKGAQIDENDHLSPNAIEAKLKADPRAQPDAATLRRLASGIIQDAHALATLKALAEKEDAQAQFEMGNVPYLPMESLVWFHKSADQGNAQALYTLGQRAEATAGYDKTHGMPNQTEEYKKASEEAEKWFGKLREEAEQGNAEAQFVLGMHPRIGGFTEQDENAEALKWMQKSADQGYSNAELTLGEYYEQGQKGLNKDYSEAMKWFQKAAAHGNGQAQESIGDMYHNGWGVSKDENEALKWHQKAIDTGIEPISFSMLIID